MRFLSLAAVLVLLLVPVISLAQSQDEVEVNVKSQEVNPPGFNPAEETVVEAIYDAGPAKFTYLQQNGEGKPFQFNIEGLWRCYKLNQLYVDGGGACIITRGFNASPELRLEVGYEVAGNMVVVLETAKTFGDVSYNGSIYKLVLKDQHLKNGPLEKDTFNWGYKALMAYNHQYFSEEVGISHLQANAWVSYGLLPQLACTVLYGAQIPLMDEFDGHLWTQLGLKYSF